MIVMKFGGSSLGDAQKIRHVAGLITQFTDRQPIVVVSAMYKVTDHLLATASLAQTGDEAGVDTNLHELRNRHHAAAEGVTESRGERTLLLGRIDRLFDEARDVFHGVLLLNELTPRSKDLLVSFGERWSAHLVAAALRDRGLASYPVDARSFVLTDSTYCSAIVDLDETKKRFREQMRPNGHNWIQTYPTDARTTSAGDREAQSGLPVITGFIGRTREGITTTIGRNGTDYTAAIVGYAAGAEEVWIWKDVDGVMTANPKLYPRARVMARLSYREAAEISHFGGEVVHPKTVHPAILAGIPIRIKNTFKPDYPGTLIVAEANEKNDSIITSSIDNLTLMTVEGTGLQASPAMAARILSAVTAAGVNMYMISMASSEYNISFLVSRQDALTAQSALEGELEALRVVEHSIDPIRIDEHVAIIACVGANLKGRVGIAGKIFSTLGRNGVNIIAIAQGSSEYNISIVVASDDLCKAVACIHDELDGTL